MEATQHTVDHPATLLIAVTVGQFNRLIEGHRGWCAQAFQVNHSQPENVAVDPRQSRQSPTFHHLIQPGVVLLYYTDGVTEAPGITGDRFDEARLIRALETACRSGQGAQGILESLFERLDRFVGPDRQLEDDASLVVLKVPEAVTLPSVQGRSIA